MPSLEAKRTLVKSPPEIWAEVSDAGALARHLGEFGEIRITRTQPESLVEWEGEKASGCVRLEPSGWGTKVTLTAEATTPLQQGSDLAIEHDAGLQDLTPVAGAARTTWWSRFRRRRAPEPEPVPVQALAPQPAPTLDSERAQAALTGVLDTLGAAHHRPFSRP
jgi:hypothetical protein